MATKPRGNSDVGARKLEHVEGWFKNMCRSKEEFETHSPDEQVRATLWEYAKSMQALQHATDEQLVLAAREQAVANMAVADKLRQLVLELPDQTMEQLHATCRLMVSMQAV
jgi:hypothetical protein